MKFGRTYNKKITKFSLETMKMGSIDVISNDWNEFELVQSKMFDMGFHLLRSRENGTREKDIENYFSF